MNNKISIIGGDLRIVKLAKLIKEEGYEISTFGLEQSEEILNENKTESIEECIFNANTVITSIPFSKDGKYVNTPFSDLKIQIQDFFLRVKNKKIILGGINNEIKSQINIENKLEIIDILENEPITIMNSIPTAEGAIQIAMEQSMKTLHGSNVLILGFGRIGKILAKMIKGIGAEVYCEARKDTDIAWIQAYDYRTIRLDDIDNYLEKFDFIFNTIPYLILDKQKLEKLKKDCVIIDLASYPGGIDFEEANKLKIKTIWALGLPRKSSTRFSCTIFKK